MPDVPKTLFQQIYGRAMTQADRDRLLRVKGGLGLSERDELWPILMALDEYSATTSAARAEIVQLLTSLPITMQATLSEVEKSAGRRAETAVARVVEQAVENLSRTVVNRTQATAEHISARQKIIAALAGAVLALIFALAGGAGTYLFLDQQIGLCTEGPFNVFGGRTGCYVD
jgi:hypothetical protein